MNIPSKNAINLIDISAGDIVVVSCNNCYNEWWIGHVLHTIYGARSKDATLFQIACIDTDEIRTVNADLIIGRLDNKDICS